MSVGLCPGRTVNYRTIKEELQDGHSQFILLNPLNAQIDYTPTIFYLLLEPTAAAKDSKRVDLLKGQRPQLKVA
jgi:hypothetical protein